MAIESGKTVWHCRLAGGALIARVHLAQLDRSNDAATMHPLLAFALFGGFKLNDVAGVQPARMN
jgi:hypothetical protein